MYNTVKVHGADLCLVFFTGYLYLHPGKGGERCKLKVLVSSTSTSTSTSTRSLVQQQAQAQATVRVPRYQFFAMPEQAEDDASLDATSSSSDSSLVRGVQVWHRRRSAVRVWIVHTSSGWGRY